MPNLPSAAGRHIIIPIAGLVGFALLMVVGFVWFSAHTQDQAERHASVEAISDFVQVRAKQVGKVAKDYAWWNDSVAYLELEPDREWADLNVGGYVYDTHGYEVSLVVSPSNELSYAALEGESLADPRELLATFDPGLRSMIAAARATPQTEPEFITGLLPFKDGIGLFGVAAITLEESADFTRPDVPRAVLVFIKRIDSDLLAAAAQALRVRDLRIADATDAAPGEAVLPLLSVRGETLSNLIWQPRRPGKDMLDSLALPLAIAILTVAVFTGLTLVQARRAARELADSEERFRDVAEASSDWFWETDPSLDIRFLSEKFMASTGLPPWHVIGKPLKKLFMRADDKGSYSALLQALKEQQPFRDVVCLCEDSKGERRSLRISGKPMYLPKQRFAGFRGTATDITVELAARRRAQYLSLHDALTGLANRELFADKLTQALASIDRRGGHVAVVAIDLDRFKDINDTLGHSVGDQLLKISAERLRTCVRDVDTVGRLGGDEFAIVQIGLERAADAQMLCRRLIEVFAEPIMINGQELNAPVSMGVSVAPDDGMSAERLLQNADIALNRAKDEDRGNFRYFEDGMDAAIQQRQVIGHDLRRAIVRHEFELHYQPRVELADNRLAAVEGLIRWRHPTRGMVSPGEFIPVAEENGFIVELGAWVLDAACRQALLWPNLRVAVNISPVQFRKPSLISTIEDILARTGLDSRRLEVEITEGVLLQDANAALDMLNHLKALGICLSLDDFGTGFSSLSYLQRFPFDKLKIDRAFVHGASKDRDQQAIVRAIIALGHSLGLSVCAEGVEQPDDLSFLRDCACDEVQGFIFGRPQSVTDFEASFLPSRVSAVANGAPQSIRLAPAAEARPIA